VESKKKPRRGAVCHAEVVAKGRGGADGGEEGVAGEAARMRDGSEGRQRKIWRGRSSESVNIVVGSLGG
jgi:hypothetical protein